MADVLHSKNRNIGRTNHAKTVKYIRVINAVYEGNYTVRVFFNDDTAQAVDFEAFLVGKPHPQYSKYRDIEKFKTFSVDMGNLVWGENWDLIFPVEQLYKGQIIL